MIDEKKLIEDLEKQFKSLIPEDDTDFCKIWQIEQDIKIVEAQPQAGYGVGKWMGSVCSCCGESVSEWYNFKFCPMCGAKMDDYEE